MSDTKPINQLVDALPADGMTVRLLQALDFITPGEWQNVTGFDNTIRAVTGESDAAMVASIRRRALELYNDSNQGYQTAMWLYRSVDNADMALGAAAMANKVGEKISFLGFLNRITPKADKAQALDLALKLVVELVAFTKVNGLPGDSLGDFVKALVTYQKESLVRMSALICVDGLLPLGPDFLRSTMDTLGGLQPPDLESNRIFQAVKGYIPGGNLAGQLSFLGRSLDSTRDWMGGFVQQHSLSTETLRAKLGQYIEIADDKLDYVAGFLDMTTSYYEHTGTQSVARSLVARAVAEV